MADLLSKYHATNNKFKRKTLPISFPVVEATYLVCSKAARLVLMMSSGRGTLQSMLIANFILSETFSSMSSSGKSPVAVLTSNSVAMFTNLQTKFYSSQQEARAMSSTKKS